MRKKAIYGWIQLILGISLLILGLVTFSDPYGALKGIVIMYGATAVFMGILDIVFFINAEKYTGFGPILALISGIFSIMAGFMLLVYPGAGSWVMVLLLPIWFIVHCIFRMTQLKLIRTVAGNFYYYFTLIINILGIVLGITMVLWPAIAVFSAAFLVGVYLILLGIDSIVMAAGRLRRKW